MDCSWLKTIGKRKIQQPVFYENKKGTFDTERICLGLGIDEIHFTKLMEYITHLIGQNSTSSRSLTREIRRRLRRTLDPILHNLPPAWVAKCIDQLICKASSNVSSIKRYDRGRALEPRNELPPNPDSRFSIRAGSSMRMEPPHDPPGSIGLAPNHASWPPQVGYQPAFPSPHESTSFSRRRLVPSANYETDYRRNSEGVAEDLIRPARVSVKREYDPEDAMLSRPPIKGYILPRDPTELHRHNHRVPADRYSHDYDVDRFSARPSYPSDRYRALDERAPERRVEERAPEERAPKRRAEERPPGERAPEKRVQGRYINERTPGERAPEERAPAERAPEKKVQERFAEGWIPGERAADQSTLGHREEERALGHREREPDLEQREDRAPGGRAPEKRVLERLAEERTPGERAPDEIVPQKPTVETGTSDNAPEEPISEEKAPDPIIEEQVSEELAPEKTIVEESASRHRAPEEIVPDPRVAEEGSLDGERGIQEKVSEDIINGLSVNPVHTSNRDDEDHTLEESHTADLNGQDKTSLESLSGESNMPCQELYLLPKTSKKVSIKEITFMARRGASDWVLLGTGDDLTGSSDAPDWDIFLSRLKAGLEFSPETDKLFCPWLSYTNGEELVGIFDAFGWRAGLGNMLRRGLCEFRFEVKKQAIPPTVDQQQLTRSSSLSTLDSYNDQ